MKTRITSIIFLLLFSLSPFVHAQTFRGSGIRYAIGAETGLAVNYLAKKHQMLAGVSLQADFPILDQELYTTLNTGYNHAFVRPDYSHLVEDMNVIPLKVGLKYFYRKFLYAQSEVGVSFLLNKTNCVEGKNRAYVLAPQIGILLPALGRNFIDIGMRFESTGKFYVCDKQNNFVGLRVAWTFSD